MRIALLLSGQLGHFCFVNSKRPKSCAEFWKNIVNQYDIDVFCFTDDDNFYFNECQYFTNEINMATNKKRESWRNHKNQKLIDHKNAGKIINELLHNTFTDKLKKSVVMENSDNHCNMLVNNLNENRRMFYNYKNSHRKQTNKVDMLAQFYKLKECFNLMTSYENDNKFKYDIIIRSRFDILIRRIMDIRYDLRQINCVNKIYSNYSTVMKHINDWWMIGDRFIMEKICSYYDNMCPNLMDSVSHIVVFKDNEFLKVVTDSCIIKKEGEQWRDVSDSSEVGFTYIIQQNNYDIDHETLEAQPWRYYD